MISDETVIDIVDLLECIDRSSVATWIDDIECVYFPMCFSNRLQTLLEKAKSELGDIDANK